MINCNYCGVPMKLAPSQVGLRKFCSRKCQQAARELVPGTRFGRLVVVSRIDGVLYNCKCDCGNLVQTRKNDMARTGPKRTQSCGCLQSETTTARNTTHGQTRTPEWIAFVAARQRCRHHKDYAGRGLTFEFASFDEWLADLGPRPSRAHSVDRKDNSLGYRPGNVQWATKKEQASNRRPRRSP
jgi:hypothetical protein